MLAVSRSSGDRSMRHRAKPANRRETHNRLRAGPSAHNDFMDSAGEDADNDDSGEEDGDDKRHALPDSSQIRAATAGRMSRRCVYSSSAVANQSVSRKGCQATITEMAHRNRNAAFGARLIIASRSDGSTRDHTRHLSATHSMRKKNRPPQRAAARSGQGSVVRGLGSECKTDRRAYSCILTFDLHSPFFVLHSDISFNRTSEF
jgi:hypothetical protein